jgi:hypothetical protein
VLVEALKEIVTPGGLVGALKEVVLDLRIVAPDALVVGSCSNRDHALSGWQPAVGKAGGEALEASGASASRSVRIKVYFVEGLLVPIVAFLHVLLDLLAGNCISKGASFTSWLVLLVDQ